MPNVSVCGHTFHVDQRGEGEPLVLLHGFTGSAASWWPVIDALGEHYQTTTIDLPGHGASDAPQVPARYGFEQAVDDLAGVAAQLGIDRAAWLGYSLGGRLALGLALRHPALVSALVLESATAGIADGAARARRRANDEALARRIEEQGVEAFVAEWERLPLWESQRSLPHWVLERQRAMRRQNQPSGLANSLRSMGQGAQPSLWDRLGEIGIPSLLITGASDEKFAGIAARMQTAIPRATLVVVPDAGHAVHLERPALFTEHVCQFLARNASVAARTR